MIRAILLALLGFAIAAGVGVGLGVLKIGQFKAMSAPSAQPPVLPDPVTTAIAREEVWQPRLQSVGSVTAVQGTLVATESDGVVREIKFHEGSAVKAGDVLVQLDTDVEMGLLREAVAAAELAQASNRRTQELAATKSVAQQELDTTLGNLKQTTARVENLKAVIAKKTIRAPFAGKLGIRRISVGQYLAKGSPVVSLQALDPVYVDFSMPQQQLGQLAEGLEVEVTTDAYTSETFKGKLTAINPDIDASTRNVRAQATLSNPAEKLRPGMFVTVNVVLAKSEKVIFIPATAVQHAPYGDSVFIVDEDKKAPPKDGATTKSLIVRQEFVRLGARHGDFVVATEGIKPGESVVSTGVFKLRPGAHVVIDNTLAPKFSLNPKPENT